MIYVMSDLHGDYERFMKMIDKINLKKEDTLYILGDVLDRGKEGIKILKYIMNKDNIVMTIGNHEDWFLNSIQNPSDTSMVKFWLGFGGEETLKEFETYPEEEQLEIIKYLKRCRCYEIVHLNNKTFFLSHAGLYLDHRMKNFNVSEILSVQERSDFTFETIEFFRLGNIAQLYPAFKDFIFIFGHFPKNYIMKSLSLEEENPMTIWKDEENKDKICLDCGTFLEEGQVGCLRLNDMKEFYIK